MHVVKQQDHYHNVTTHTSRRSPPVSPTKIAKSSSSFSSSSTRSSSRPVSPQNLIDEENHDTLYIPPMTFHNRWKQSNKSRSIKNMVVSNQVSVMWAPPPAMYWSQPTVHGVVPKPVRAHTSVAVNDLMYVFGGSGNHGCSHTLYALEMGKIISEQGE